jgi:hypothetical protein
MIKTPPAQVTKFLSSRSMRPQGKSHNSLGRIGTAGISETARYFESLNPQALFIVVVVNSYSRLASDSNEVHIHEPRHDHEIGNEIQVLPQACLSPQVQDTAQSRGLGKGKEKEG